MSKVYRFNKHGSIEYNDDSIPEYGCYPPTSDRYAEIVASGVQIEPYAKSLQEAFDEGVNYIKMFYNDAQLQDLTALIELGDADQRMKIAEVYQWMNILKQSALTNPQSFEPSGQPPYTYFEIIGVQ